MSFDQRSFGLCIFKHFSFLALNFATQTHKEQDMNVEPAMNAFVLNCNNNNSTLVVDITFNIVKNNVFLDHMEPTI